MAKQTAHWIAETEGEKQMVELIEDALAEFAYSNYPDLAGCIDRQDIIDWLGKRLGICRN